MQIKNILLDDLDFTLSLNVLVKNKYLIFFVSLLFAVVSVLVAVNIPNKYGSVVKLTIAEQDKTSSLASMAGSLGGLASMAGLNIGGKGDKGLYYSELLKSKAFIIPFIKKYDLGPQLIAVNGWEISNNKLQYDIEKYDPKAKTWTREVEYPYSNPPTDWELYESFRKVVNFEYDKKGSFITIRAIYFSPYFTKTLLDNLVYEFNELRRSHDISEAQKSIDYLKKEIESSSVIELNQLSYTLITENKKTLMLANIREEYALEVIEPATVSEKKVGPKRAMICIAISLLGMIFAFSLPFIYIAINTLKKKLIN